MIANRELSLDDYLAILRRRRKLILAAVLPATVIGFLVSFAFSPQYTSHSLVQVERQTIPAGYVRPIVTTSAIDRIATVQQQVLSRSQLEQLVNRLGLARKRKGVDEVIDDIQENTSITDAGPSAVSNSSFFKKSTDFLGFYVNFTANDPHDAQQICAEITSMLLRENLRMREQVASNTTDFLSRQLNEAKSNLDQKDQELAQFKSRYLGQLPSDVENNIGILGGLHSELDANTQSLIRAQQDKSYAESLLTQQLAAWKSSQSSPTSETIRQRLVTLQTQLVTLQARYTDDYPEVIKMKADIAALEAKEKEQEKGANVSGEQTAASAAKPDSDAIGNAKVEPPEILQLRERIHQNEGIIERATREETRLQALIDSYQGRLTLSPKVEEEYKRLTRDNDVAHRVYDSLLINKSESEMQTDLEHQQQGEQLRMLDPATLPDSPSFPVRWRFAGGGLVAGFALGLIIVVWLEVRDRAIRDEKDVHAALEMPMLTAVPWVNPAVEEQPSGLRERLRTLLRA